MTLSRLERTLLLSLLCLGGLRVASAHSADAGLPSTHAVLVGVHPWEPLPGLLTDPSVVYTEPQVAKGGYLVSGTDPVFGSNVMRITNNVGNPTAPVSGSWGSDARHVYSKQEPWNADMSLVSVQNRSGGSPSQVFLDGTTYLPKFGPCSGSPLYDYRWHPSLSHKNEMINVNASGNELCWWDVVTCTKTRRWTLPITADYGIGSGEGNASNDGRFVVLGNASQMMVVDMDPQPPYAPYPSVRMGPVYAFPPCSLDVNNPTYCPIDNLQMSASGTFVIVKYGTTVDTTEDMHRVYEVDPATLALKPHNMATASVRCGSFQARPNGWIFGLKHSDVASNPFDHDEDVILGGRSCPGSTIGKVDMVRLRDGQVTALTDPNNEASVFHVSARNLRRPGWVYVSYFKTAGKRFSDEVISVKMDGSRTVERWAYLHSDASGCYRCEPQPAPSPDGQRLIFASNWVVDCGTGCGTSSDIKDYVVWSPGAAGIGNVTSPAPRVSLAIEAPNPAPMSPHIVYSLGSSAPARLEVFDVAGRRVQDEELGSPGPGRHETTLNEAKAPGLYWLRLSQGDRTVSRQVTLIR